MNKEKRLRSLSLSLSLSVFLASEDARPGRCFLPNRGARGRRSSESLVGAAEIKFLADRGQADFLIVAARLHRLHRRRGIAVGTSI